MKIKGKIIISSLMLTALASPFGLTKTAAAASHDTRYTQSVGGLAKAVPASQIMPELENNPGPC